MVAGTGLPRTVADATRFTSNTPHASNKSSSSTSTPTVDSTSTSNNRQGNAAHARSSPIPQQRQGLPRHTTPETLEERVRRLRAAHLAARQHKISRLDNIISASRRFFDNAHKFSVATLIGGSSLALLLTAYAAGDMMLHNRQRRNEFVAMQKQLKEDSLESARLAYMSDTATEEQIALVEDVTNRAKQEGWTLPPLLSAPQTPMGSQDSAAVAAAAAAPTTERTIWPGEALVESNISSSSAGGSTGDVPTKKRGWVASLLFGGLKSEDTTTTTFSEPERRQLNFGDGLSSDSASGIKEKAKVAFDEERENRRRGGPLDQVSLDDKPSSEAVQQENQQIKKRWLW